MRTSLGICILVIVAAICAAVLMDRARIEASLLARDARGAVESVLHVTPTISVTSYVARQTNSDILELSTVEKQFPQQYSFEHTFLGSTKKLVLTGDYSVKAGFDLRDRFTIQIDQKTGMILADFPSPTVLSVELKRFATVEDEDGWWNKLGPEDRAAAVNGMNAAARRSALQTNILEEARDSVKHRLENYEAAGKLRWQITFRGTHAKAAGD